MQNVYRTIPSASAASLVNGGHLSTTGGVSQFLSHPEQAHQHALWSSPQSMPYQSKINSTHTCFPASFETGGQTLEGTLMDRLNQSAFPAQLDENAQNSSSQSPSSAVAEFHPDTVFSKSLPHDLEGLLDRDVFAQLVYIWQHATPDSAASLWGSLPLGNEGGLTLAQPLSGYTRWNVQWLSAVWKPVPPPALGSLQWALDLIRLWEMSLCRDVPFGKYHEDAQIRDSCARLAALPVVAARTQAVSPNLLFRGSSMGDQLGPYVSQFLIHPVPPVGACGMLWIQKYRFPQPRTDFLKEWREFNAARNGAVIPSEPPMEESMRYVRCGRDLAWLIHEELPVKHFLHALQIMMAMEAPWKPHTPYSSPTFHQLPHDHPSVAGFPRAALSELISLMGQVAEMAQQVAYQYKWRVYLHARPEERAWLVERTRQTRVDSYGLHPLMLNAPVLEEIFRRQGNLLLSQVRREGAPASPSHPCSIAAACGALSTLLKAFFREDWTWPRPLAVDAEGGRFHPLPTSVSLSVGGELDKLASNLSMGCAWSGRNTVYEIEVGLRLGEELAVHILSDILSRYAEREICFTFRLRDGSLIELK